MNHWLLLSALLLALLAATFGSSLRPPEIVPAVDAAHGSLLVHVGAPNAPRRTSQREPQAPASTNETSVVCTEALVNGGFEDGPASGWSLETDDVGWLSGKPIKIDDVILSNEDFGQDTAAEGEWAGQLGGGPDFEMLLAQTNAVSMLPEADLVTATLRYAFAYDTEKLPDGTADDLFAAFLVHDSDRRVQIDGTGFSEEQGLPTKAWLEIEADITELMVSHLPAATRRLAFNSVSGGYDFTTHLVDAVSLEMCIRMEATPTPTASPSPMPSATPSPTPTAAPAPVVWLPYAVADDLR